MSDEAAVPAWAVELREKVARIDERTSAGAAQMTTIVEGIETLRRTTVPITEHQLLMTRVDELWSRDLGARGEWEEMRTRVGQLWLERAELAGVRRGYRALFVVLGGATSVLSLWTLLHDLGLTVAVHP